MISDAMLEIDHPCIGIADSTAVDTAGWDLSKAINKGVVKLFEDLDALATFYGMDTTEFNKTVQTFNDYVEQGLDEAFKKPIVKQAKPIFKPPFYAMRLWPKVHFTMGGVLVNSEAQVLDFEGGVIKGLYAAGEVVGGVHGASRLGSCAITECIVFGRIAGQNI
jgi:succinate dehydrogenase/fumarate reductase flavoprotein subunit